MPSQTTCSSSSVLSVLRSQRKDIIDRNRLKNSKFTGNSEKETSVGDQSIFFNQKVNPNQTQLSIETDNYSKMKTKFDSQPYFYQNSTVSSQFSNGQSGERQTKIQFPHRQLSSNSLAPQTDLHLAECLANKS